jgi:hypothetical protein
MSYFFLNSFATFFVLDIFYCIILIFFVVSLYKACYVAQAGFQLPN